MNTYKLITRSLIYYWRTHLGVLLGAAVSTAVLVGALVVGDSVRYSLRKLSLDKLGQTEFAMLSADRFFKADLVTRLGETAHAAPVLQVPGIGIADGGRRRVNQIQVLGVDYSFFKFAPRPAELAELGEDEAYINARLALHLGLKTGDEFLLRLGKIHAVSTDIPFISGDATGSALRLRIKEILATGDFGDFSLRISQAAPLNVFLPLDRLAAKLEQAERANILLLKSKTDKPLSEEKLQQQLQQQWQMADAGLKITKLPETDVLELTSSQVFINPVVSSAALASGKDGRGILTYFVNELKSDKGKTPYSFVAAPGRPIVPADMGKREIIINQWLADDLQVKVGDKVKLTYFVIGPLRRLVTKSATFIVRQVIPVTGNAEIRSLMPHFSGLSDAESCRDWDPDLPIDLDQIRTEKDEAYWKQYKGTPKAFVSLAAAQELWQNRYGNLTAIRFPAAENKISEIAANFSTRLDPAAIGFTFIPIREKALQAGKQSVDFGQLFIGLSFFLIASALLLTSLLFVFAVEKRALETGVLLAIGFPAKMVKRMLLAEGTVLALIGALLGTAGGVIYNNFILWALGSLWRGAVGTSMLHAQLRPQTLLIGFAASIIISMICLWWALRKQGRMSIAQLQTAELSVSQDQTRGSWVNLLLALVCGAAAVGIMIFVPATGGKSAAGVFFGAGALLLVAVLAVANLFLVKLEQGISMKMSRWSLQLRDVVRRRGRSLVVIALLACGIFLVIAVAANRHNPIHGSYPRSSGTGGFAYYGESTLPIAVDLNTPEGRKSMNLAEAEFAKFSFVQLRLKEGDDASCLNLNRVQNPAVLGVDPKAFSERHSFSFAKLADGIDKKNPWQSILVDYRDPEANVIPAVADQNVILWGLGKKIGDTISYTDDQGQEVKLRLVGGLANSIFQGSLLIAEKDFIRHFPNTDGTRVMVVDTPEPTPAGNREELTEAMEDYGLELVDASQRLAEFNTVENTYLSIFLMLGGLGVILGTVGLGIVMLRNVLERCRELALMRAVGFSRGELFNLLMMEHLLLLLSGLVCGTVAGVVAVLPAVVTAGGSIPTILLISILGIILLNGLLWIAIAARSATRGDLLPALRRE